jgi:hypothetical protein
MATGDRNGLPTLPNEQQCGRLGDIRKKITITAQVIIQTKIPAKCVIDPEAPRRFW